jgi:hypothetical protein
VTDATRLDQTTISTLPQRPLSGEKPLSLHDSLIAQFGPAVGAAMYAIELEARRKAAERLRELQMKLLAINSQIEGRVRENDRALVPFTQRMEASYAAWLRDCEARDAKMIADQGSLVELRNAATDLIKAINEPAFADKVRNWGAPDWQQAIPAEWQEPR